MQYLLILQIDWHITLDIWRHWYGYLLVFWRIIDRKPKKNYNTHPQPPALVKNMCHFLSSCTFANKWVFFFFLHELGSSFSQSWFIIQSCVISLLEIEISFPFDLLTLMTSLEELFFCPEFYFVWKLKR